MPINVGDKLDLTGSTKLLDGASSGLWTMNWDQMGSQQRQIDVTTRWKPGYKNGRWSNNADGSGPVWWSTLNIGSEDELYPTLDCITANGPGVVVAKSDGPNGPLRIHPRMFTPTELAKYGTRSELANHAWLSWAMVTAPDSVAPPAYFELTCQFPKGHQGDLSGIWLAFWQLDNAGEWPPEIDTFETFGNASGGAGPDFELAIHTTDPGWSSKLNKSDPKIVWINPDGSTASARLSPMGFDPSAGMHSYGSLVTAEGTFGFIDRVCVMVWPQASDIMAARLYPIVDFAVGKPGSGAGAPSGNDVGEAVIGGVEVWKFQPGSSGGATGATGATGPSGSGGGNTGSTGASGATGGSTGQTGATGGSAGPTQAQVVATATQLAKDIAALQVGGGGGGKISPATKAQLVVAVQTAIGGNTAMLGMLSGNFSNAAAQAAKAAQAAALQQVLNLVNGL